MMSHSDVDQQARELYLHESLELCQYLEEGLLLLTHSPTLEQLPRLLRSLQMIITGAEQLGFEDLQRLGSSLEKVLQSLAQPTPEAFPHRDTCLAVLPSLCEQLRFTLLLTSNQISPQNTSTVGQTDLIEGFLIPKSFVILQEALLLTDLLLCQQLWQHQLHLFRSWSLALQNFDAAAIAITTLQSLELSPEAIQAIAPLAIAALQILSKPKVNQDSLEHSQLESSLEFFMGDALVKNPSQAPLPLSNPHFYTQDHFLWLSDGYLFYVPAGAIAEIVVPHLQNITQTGGQSYLQWQDQKILLYDVNSLILAQETSLPIVDHGPALILKQEQHYLALALEIEHLIMETVLPLEAPPSSASPNPTIMGWTRIKDIPTPMIDVHRWLQEHPMKSPTILPAQSQSIATPLILVVDDSRTIREQVSITLQKAHYKVLQAADGQEALIFLEQHPGIGLVICDIEMGNLNGFEFLRNRLHYETFSHIPVIILSSHTSPEYRQLAQKLGAIAYLTIPYEPKSLLATITVALEG